MEKKKSKKSYLNVTGMHCASCAQTIEKALREHRGVKEANVNFATEKAYVVYDPNLTGKKELIETVRSTGYDMQSETKKTIVKIGGMTCASCAQTIENALKKTEGIIAANVNLATEKAVVVYDPQGLVETRFCWKMAMLEFSWISIILKDRECEVMSKSKAVHDLLRDCVSLEDARN